MSVTRVGSDSPVPAARLLAEETRTRTTHRSSPAGSDGRVALDRLPPGRYALAVELDGGVYPALTPVLVRDDRTETLQIQLAEEPKPQVSGTFARLWGNPITATLMILGAAIVLGVAIDAASDNPTPRVSPASP